MAAKKTMVIDLDRCIGCYACEVACKQENDVALGVYRNKVATRGPVGRFPDLELYYMSNLCQACENPPCVGVCPTRATVQRAEDGIVTMRREICLGSECQLCIEACPYGARSLNRRESFVEKCDLCSHMAEGEKPACVTSCPGFARFSGDINDPRSDVSAAVAEAGAENVHAVPDVDGAQPAVRYILHEKIAAWRE